MSTTLIQEYHAPERSPLVIERFLRDREGVWRLLDELRAIMDTAYRVTVITEIYGRPAQIDRLVAEVQQIEAEIAEHVARQLLARDGDAQAELLDGRLATLRMCVRELAGVAA